MLASIPSAKAIVLAQSTSMLDLIAFRLQEVPACLASDVTQLEQLLWQVVVLLGHNSKGAVCRSAHVPRTVWMATTATSGLPCRSATGCRDTRERRPLSHLAAALQPKDDRYFSYRLSSACNLPMCRAT